MKAVKFGGRSRARRFSLRLLFVVLACSLALSGMAARFGASAQKSAQGSAKQVGQMGASRKVAPLTASRSKFKAQGAKTAAAPGGDAQPLVLGCANATQTITVGTPVNGTLTNTDCVNPTDNSFYDAYSFSGTAGQQVVISMTSTAFDTYLYLMVPGETTLRNLSDPNPTIQDDDGGGGTNSRLPSNQPLAQAPPFNGTLPTTGTYTIIANSFAVGATGAYTLSLNAPCTPTVTPISIVGGTGSANGSLSTTDCTLDDGSFYDVYTFNATAGQQVSIQMSASAFNPFLFLVAPDNDQLFVDDSTTAHAGSTRIPSGTGTVRLPQTGTYRIIANSFAAGATGSYSLSLSIAANNCPSTAINVGQTINGTLASGDCLLPADSSFIDVYTFSGTAGQTISIAMNSSDFDTFLFLLSPTGSIIAQDDNGSGTINARIPAGTGTLTLPTTGTYTIYANSSLTGKTGNYTLALAGPQCATTIFPNVIPFTQGAGTGRFTVFPASAQCNTWTAATATSWIHITAPASGAGTGTSRVRFTVDANTGTATRTGTITVGTSTLTVTQTSSATPPQVQFSNATYSVNENDASKSVQITVQRLGDTTGAATVEYHTVDDPAAVPCSTANGTAYARCDYVTTIDTLTFNAGETAKTLTIPLIDDVHVEGNETFQIALANPQGASLGTPINATVTIVDNDTAQATTNPIHNQNVAPGQTAFFVRMQYLDFLSREPEAGEPWTAVYAPCPNQDNTDPNSASAICDRIHVSSNFFLSQEFQLKGFFVFLYYKVSFGSQSNPNYFPQYDEIVPDMRRITGATTEERVDKTFNFAEDWVTRSAFVTRYGAMTNAQFVDTLLANVGATLTTADPVSGQTRNSLVAALDAGTKTRAEVLRIIVESQEVNRLQFNPAFVAMQYYGYLRRTPEISGYIGWLNTINPPTSANPRDMVNGFVNSAEYYLRFGPNVRQ